MGLLLLAVFIIVVFFIIFKQRNNLIPDENLYTTAELGTAPKLKSKVINCPRCDNGVSKNADECPFCKLELKPQISKTQAVVFCFVLLFVGIWVTRSPGDSQYYDQNASLDACENYIKPRLKNPSSADFDTANAKVLEPKPDFKTVFLTVHATNSFNAIVPTHYACFVRNVSGKWTVEEIQETAQ
ncbi:MAG TPA: hypothetical protein VK958_06410 [Methylophilus sp.]|nr:hypothetical protein [Methylophilus sp.]